jgi:Holliday junction resolvasome RuvABC DNA-binding subunit
MFHYIKGEIKTKATKWNLVYICNDLFGIQASYAWKQTNWEFFLHPHLDDNKKTINYFAFDSSIQKDSFIEVLKVNWVWPKTAFQIVQLPQDKLQVAVNTLDAKFFQSISGIWPKSAKKILLELKWSFEIEDIQKMDIDQKLYRNIVNSLKGLWYDTNSIKSTLQKYHQKITKENMANVIKRVISKI